MKYLLFLSVVLVCISGSLVSAEPICAFLFKPEKRGIEVSSPEQLAKEPLNFGRLFSRKFVDGLLKALPEQALEAYSEVITLVTNPQREARLTRQYVGKDHITKYYDEMGEANFRAENLSSKNLKELEPYFTGIKQMADKLLIELQESTGDKNLKINLMELRRAKDLPTMGGYRDNLPADGQRPHLDSEKYEKYTFLSVLEASHLKASTVFFPEGEGGKKIETEIYNGYLFDGSQLLHLPPTQSYAFRFYLVISFGH